MDAKRIDGMKKMFMNHGGNLRRLGEMSGKAADEILDFSANINPLGPPPWMRPLISSRIRSLAHYPDPDCAELLAAAAARYGVATGELIAGNGSAELLYLVARVVEKRGLIPVPSYVDYARACATAGREVCFFPLRQSEGFSLNPEALDAALAEQPALVFIGQPNNPTGTVCEPETLRRLARRHANSVFLIDEAFADFVEGLDSLTKDRPDNVIVLLSLTKSFAIPGLRLGLAVADAAMIRRLRELQPPWPVNTLAMAVGAEALADKEYQVKTRQYVDRARARMVDELQRIGGFTVYPGRANFLLLRLDHAEQNAADLTKKLLRQGIAIRDCGNFQGLDSRFIRIAIRSEEENARLITAVESLQFPDLHQARRPVPRRTPAIMFQGTSSNAGKSVLTAAMCRILLQDGFRVAPFKAQNMSLNSFVTRDGGEMGRAQVVQAQACRLEPETRMNPVLLKPGSDVGSQVIVRGRPIGNMTVEEYIRFKPEAFRAAKEAYDSLAHEYDVIVLEGAGSPGEVNLKRHDIVNMNMARYAGAPVLLVGDIDRGGVFASFVGTMEVLAEWERALVAGFVVNRFRGRASLLDDAFAYTERHTGKPVYGVIPYLARLGLPEEDSVTFKESVSYKETPPANGVEIAVIDLPHISNFTDFDALGNEPDVVLRVVRAPEKLGTPDAIILPGSKNVLKDMEYLRRVGLDQAILRQSQGAEIIGICGGYQMLGSRIDDTIGVESDRLSIPGLNLLELTTVMASEKTLLRVEARHVSGLSLHGYEIHHGRSEGPGLQPLIFRSDDSVIGSGRDNVWGTYLHGLFDADEFRRWFIDRLRQHRGLEPLREVQAAYDLEPALDRLAETVRQSLRVDELYRLMALR